MFNFIFLSYFRALKCHLILLLHLLFLLHLLGEELILLSLLCPRLRLLLKPLLRMKDARSTLLWEPLRCEGVLAKWAVGVFCEQLI
jgi:hypothetical protein